MFYTIEAQEKAMETDEMTPHAEAKEFKDQADKAAKIAEIEKSVRCYPPVIPPTTKPLKIDFTVGDYKIHLEVTHLR